VETRREILRRGAAAGSVAVLGTVAAAALGATRGPASRAPSATLRIYRIGVLWARAVGPCEPEPSDWQATDWGQFTMNAPLRPLDAACPQSIVTRALEVRGYRLGDNLELMRASPPTGVSDFTKPAAEIVARKVDLIIAVSSNAAYAAKDATTTIPIVVTNIGDVVENGLVPDLARPGGNITGLAVRTLDLALKRVELLREAFPSATRPLLLYASQVSQRRAADAAVESARQLGLSSTAIEMGPDPTEAVTMARKAIAEGADSLVVIAGSPSLVAILAMVKEHRLPAVFSGQGYLNAGGALALANPIEDYAAKADYVDRILRGAKPGDLPILLPTKFELIVNLKAAEALGTPIAPAVVAAATKVTSR
jgi:putative ABC transport system substrate-binding protein